MSSVLRVVSFGLGPIGLAAARLALQKKSIQLVGAIDVAPEKVGKDLAELLELPAPTGVVVEADAEAALRRLQPDAILHCTSSFMPLVKDQLLLAARCGVNVVSSTEELLVPDLQHAEIAKELDAAAIAGGVSLLGTGVNPGFAMDFMAAIASAVTFDVKSARCVRVVDAATRRLPLQRKVGASLSASEFQKELATGRFGHIGMRESVALLARGLGLAVDRIEQTVEPVLAAEDHKTPFLTVKEGQVAGIRNHGYGYSGQELLVHLDLSMYVGAPDPRDEIVLDSTPPVHLKFQGGIAGDQATAAILVNSLHSVVAAEKGLRTVLDVAPPRLCR
ncbi:MAG: dihydrodipicolinate reductase [Planctomycetes bacterium]|nr:dihydrodipicolinate reductase [Planctomycetota bacterium]MCB9884489.1 dihydrodipicolinate reductase [Planctomycetota bacterium]